MDGTPARREESTESVPEPWHVALLDRFAACGIPLGMALLPWGRFAAFAGLMVLVPFAVALARLLVDLARHLKKPTEATEAKG